MSGEWDVPLGGYLSRAERMQRFGGGKQGGIEQSAKTPNVFVYSDPESGEKHGYRFDGWTTDGSAFLYTGEGQYGDQTLTGGNLALLNHSLDGRTVRLFVAAGVVAGGKEKIQKYVGEFRVDPSEPYTRGEAPDNDGVRRSVLIFRLLPIDAQTPDPGLASGVPQAAQTEVTDVSLELGDSLEFAVPGSAPTSAQRREFELVQRYAQAIADHGGSYCRWRIRPRGENITLYTDLYWEDRRELCEAKGDTTRANIREAIGQLLDYKRYLNIDGIKLAVLVPVRPSEDLLALTRGLGIRCIYEESPGKFQRVDP